MTTTSLYLTEPDTTQAPVTEAPPPLAALITTTSLQDLQDEVDEEDVAEQAEGDVVEQVDTDASEAEVGEEAAVEEQVEGEVEEQVEAEAPEAEEAPEADAVVEEDSVERNSTVAALVEAGREAGQEVVGQVDRMATLHDVDINTTAHNVMFPSPEGQAEQQGKDSTESGDDFNDPTSLYEAASEQLKTALKAAGLD